MQMMNIHPLIFYFFIFIIVILIGLSVFLFMQWSKYLGKDVFIMLTKENRYFILYEKFSGRKVYTHNRKNYNLVSDACVLNSKGKALYIFSEDNPMPLKIRHKKPDWLDSESLLAVINNDLVKQIVRPSDPIKDQFMMFGAIGGLIAGASSIIILLIQVGVFG